MSILTFSLIVVVVILIMECVAWVSHKYVMHGWLWVLHKSHHEPRKGWFELNDLFGVFFAAISIGLMLIGRSSWPPAFAAGIGVAAYGAIYFLFHDILVHRRVDLGLRPKSGYLARVNQAHQLHHAVSGKHGCVSFGFIFAPSPQHLKRMLKETQEAELRTPTGMG